MIEEKTWIAYAIHRGEHGCGCSRTTYSYVYDKTGNHKEKFTDRDLAVSAAIAKMLETNADDWNVI